MNIPTKQNFNNVTIAALELLPDCRMYAFDQQAKDEAAAITAAIFEGRIGYSAKDVADRWSELRPSTPEAWQVKPTAEGVVRQWIDPVTGLPAKNPFDKSDPDPDSQAVLETADPALAQHLRAIAKKGVTYKLLHQIELGRAQRKEVRDLKYGPEQHKANPWVTDDGRAQQAIKQRNPLLAEFYRRESIPPVLNPAGPLQNMTKLSAILTFNPAHGAILQRAAAIHGQWHAQHLAQIDSDLLRAREAKQKALAGRA